MLTRIPIDNRRPDESQPHLRVFCDGEIHNRRELCRNLSVGEDDLDDRDLVAAAYERWGTDFANRLQGVYCLVVRDEKRGTTLIVRDRTGIWPAFWTIRDSTLWVGPSIQDLVNLPGGRATVDRVAVAAHVCGRFVEPDATYFNGIRRVPAGHFTMIDRRGARSTRYWMPWAAGIQGGHDLNDYVSDFEEIFGRATARAVPTGAGAVSLSGGLDSVSVAAMLSAISDRRAGGSPLGLSLAFPDPECDESGIQVATAKTLAMDHFMIPLEQASGSGGLLESALAASRNWPVPLDNFWYPAYRRLYDEAASRGVDTVLTGAGGDEWLGVTPMYAADLLAQGNLPGLVLLTRHYFRSYSLHHAALARNILWSCALRPLLASPVRTMLQKTAPGMLAARGARRAAGSLPDWLVVDMELRESLLERTRGEQEIEFTGPYRHYLTDCVRPLGHPLVSMEMEDYFEAGRRSRVRIRHPFWDAELIEFLCRVPPEILYSEGSSKSPLRHFLASRVPDEGFSRQKKVLASSLFHSRLRAEAPGILRELGGFSALENAGVVEPSQAGRFVLEFAEGTASEQGFPVWLLLNHETWLRSASANG